MSVEEEAEFASLFEASRSASKVRTKGRVEAERRAAMTDAQRSRGGRARSAQINFRCTPALKTLVTGLAEHMSVAAGEDVPLQTCSRRQ
jgi:hypothetical protein